MRGRFAGIVGSAILSTLSVVLFFYPGLNLGVDFRGGIVVELRAPQALHVDKIREAFAPLGFGDLRVQEFGSPQDVLVRFENQANLQDAQRMIASRVAEALPGVQIRRTEVVGARVSSELFRNGLLATGLALLAVLVYIWFRFEWQFGVGVVATLILDVTKTVGFFAVTQIQFDLNSVAALLTLIGYSVTDKVVVYDRIRENLGKYRTMPLRQLIDLSINQTLGRTVATSLTVVLSILPLALIGGEVMRGFGLAIIFGIVIGTPHRSSSPRPYCCFLVRSGYGLLRRARRSRPRAPQPRRPPQKNPSQLKFALICRYGCLGSWARGRMRVQRRGIRAAMHCGSGKFRRRCSTLLLFCSSSRPCSWLSGFASRSPPI